MFRVRTLQILLFLALLLQTAPPASASDPNDTNDLVPQTALSVSASWWDSIGDPNDPNGLIVRGGAGDDLSLGRIGAVIWPIEIGLEYGHYTPEADRLDQIGVYGLVRDIGSWISGLVDYREALAALPDDVVPEFYAGGFVDADTHFDGIAYGPCVGVQAGLVFAEYRWPSSEGEIASVFDEDPALIVGGLLEF